MARNHTSRGGSESLAIDLTPMTYANHSNNPNLVVHRVENSVLANSHAIGRVETAERYAIRRAWFSCQEVEGGANAQLVWTINP